MEPDRRARRINALERLGAGEAQVDYTAHHAVMRSDFRDYRLGAAEPVIGVAAYTETLEEFRRAISDFAVDIPIPWIVDGDYAVTTWIYRGRMTGPLWGLPPSDREFTWRGCSVWTFDAEDFVTELRTFADSGHFLSQISDT